MGRGSHDSRTRMELNKIPWRPVFFSGLSLLVASGFFLYLGISSDCEDARVDYASWTYENGSLLINRVTGQGSCPVSFSGYNETTATELGPLVSASNVNSVVSVNRHGCCTRTPVYIILCVINGAFAIVLFMFLSEMPRKREPVSVGVFEMCDYLDNVKGDFGHVYLKTVPLDFESEMSQRYPEFVLRLRCYDTGFLYLWYRCEALAQARIIDDGCDSGGREEQSCTAGCVLAPNECVESEDHGDA